MEELRCLLENLCTNEENVLNDSLQRKNFHIINVISYLYEEINRTTLFISQVKNYLITLNLDINDSKSNQFGSDFQKLVKYTEFFKKINDIFQSILSPKEENSYKHVISCADIDSLCEEIKCVRKSGVDLETQSSKEANIPLGNEPNFQSNEKRNRSKTGSVVNDSQKILVSCSKKLSHVSNVKKHSILHDFNKNCSNESFKNSKERDECKVISDSESMQDFSEDNDLGRCFQIFNKKFEVTVEYVQSPSEFYVVFIDENFDLHLKLQKELKSYPVNTVWMNSTKTLKDKVLLSKSISNPVLYYSICDETFYRAQVVDWCLKFDDDLVTIFIIDSGEIKSISINYLQSMPENIKHYPTFIKKCHLCGICPTGAKKTTDFKWSKNVSFEMRQWTERAEKTLLEVNSSKCEHFPSMPVKLWLSNEEISINQLLIEKNLAEIVFMKSESNKISQCVNSSSESLNMDEWNPMKEDFESYNNIPDLNITDPASAIYGYVGNENSRVCWQFATKGKCYKGNSCRKEHEVLNPSGFTIDKEKVFISTITPHRIPRINDIIRVDVTSVVDVNEFYCTMKEPERGEDEETLEKLNAFINIPENRNCLKKLLIPPSAGQVVMVKYSGDDFWYRARIKEAEPENDAYSVSYVDYGIEETVPLLKIRAMEPQYLHLPFQGIHCFLQGIEKTSNANPVFDEGIRFLNDILMKKKITIKVVAVFPGDCVTLLVRFYDEEGNDVAEELLKQKYAIRKCDIVLDSNAESLPG